ncbi:sulfur carrier protein ThiS [Solimonas variicoloris]|uniref:sulfur carrier protein ThiS n=1 Tax=Solimonas variicoloris TaxID=254408 RepID=UPI00037E5670|nr:sulfur carrier protein ThiS [Solimonas variicoloris]
MQLTVNGEPRTLADALNIAELLAALQLGGKRVAVEVNGSIVPRSQHAATALRDGDQVLIVQAIGGG